MSAFIVNDYHVSVLVQYATHRSAYYYFNKKSIPFEGNEQLIFSKLIRANMESVNDRYEGNTPAMPGHYTPDYHRVLSPVQVIKACNCFDYQACEVENYEETEAAKIIESIRGTAIEKLAGMDDAEWEIKPREINKNIRRVV